jgi:phosphatidylinositol kinase/protein kinase (PI-3  family)
MAHYAKYIPADSVDGAFFRSILSVHEYAISEHGHAPVGEACSYVQHASSNPKWRGALRNISRTRALVDQRGLAALVGESYNRAYDQLLMLQRLTELEEILCLKHPATPASQKSNILHTWDQRLRNGQRDVDTWLKILAVRGIALRPVEIADTWLKFAVLCRKNKRFDLSRRTLVSLIGSDPVASALEWQRHRVGGGPSSSAAGGASSLLDNSYSSTLVDHVPLSASTQVNARISLAYLDHLWDLPQPANSSGGGSSSSNTQRPISSHAYVNTATGAPIETRQLALDLLFKFARNEEAAYQSDSWLATRIFRKLGEWRYERLAESGDEMDADILCNEIIRNYKTSVECDRTYYRAWHGWAMANYRAIKLFESRAKADAALAAEQGNGSASASATSSSSSSSSPTILHKRVQTHVLNAISGFFRAITLSPSHSLRDMLRLLNLWFEFSDDHSGEAATGPPLRLRQSEDLDRSLKALVDEELVRGFSSVPMETWLQVTPQVIARIHVSKLRKLASTLLTAIGRSHPQAIVFPLLCATQSHSRERVQAAQEILDNMCRIVPTEHLRGHNGSSNNSNSNNRRGQGNYSNNSNNSNNNSNNSNSNNNSKNKQSTRAQRQLLRLRSQTEDSAATQGPNSPQRIARLIAQAQLVSTELIRVSILWHEMWFDGLEEASKLFFTDHNPRQMLRTLQPLHDFIAQGAETIREEAFLQAYSRDLSDALDLIVRRGDIAGAWDLYYRVFRRISKQLPTLTTLDLAHVSPNLLRCRNLDVAVPGSYTAAPSSQGAAQAFFERQFESVASSGGGGGGGGGGSSRISDRDPSSSSIGHNGDGDDNDNDNNNDNANSGDDFWIGDSGDADLAAARAHENIVKIARFAPTFNVITSKQRPRKFVMFGSDGGEYMFLLKGHEDLRQDERVMQFFGLVNTLLAAEYETSRHHLNIELYPVIPLSPTCGLIGWVPHSDTLHALIREHREARKILVNIEHRLMLQMAPDYDHLPLINKVETFEYSLNSVSGCDLERIMWLKSANSEVWLDRRSNYTRSLAVMSMVGHILGLGDRHPSNVMLDRHTGKVLHIDFGDCFEVAMLRDKYPERIPFRLTRMLVMAMEVSGIEGTFRQTCESVMTVLRQQQESLLAILEAFVHDPIINWRLLVPFANEDREGDEDRERDAGNHESSDSNLPVSDSHHHATFDHRGNSSGGGYDHHNSSDISNNTASSEDVSVSGTFSNSSENVSTSRTSHSQPQNAPNVLHNRGLKVVKRIEDKLTGTEFGPEHGALPVSQQVEKLIQQATSHENLCQCYIGWCPFW